MERTRRALGQGGGRRGVRLSLFLGAVGWTILLATLRCADVDRGLGEACIRNEDCLSGVCAGQVCVPQPTVFDAAPLPDAAGDSAPNADAAAADVGSDVTTPPPAPDATAPPADAAKDAPSSKDAAPVPDAPSAHDAHDAMSTLHDAAGSMDAPAKSPEASSEGGSTDAHPAPG